MSRSSDEITINIKELIDEFGADDISIALEEFMKTHTTTEEKLFRLKPTIPEIWNELIKENPVRQVVYDRLQVKLKEALQSYYEATLCLDVNLTLEVLATAEAYGITLEKYYCSDCEYVFYHDEENLEDMDCGNVYALPENGAPEMISCELHNCPFYEKKQNIKNWEDYK